MRSYGNTVGNTSKSLPIHGFGAFVPMFLIYNDHSEKKNKSHRNHQITQIRARKDFGA